MINVIKEDQNLEWIELYPKVHVYRNVLSDPQNLYRIMKESDASAEGRFYLKSWDPWAHFGTYTQIKSPQEIEIAEKGQRFDEEKYCAEAAAEAYLKVISHYTKHVEEELRPSDRFSGMSFSKYNKEIDIMDNNMTMQYHTDYIHSQRDMPGPKFFITCTMYINDDYEGGDIEFFIDGNLINHKPKSGDILVFPSTQPYYHGVKVIGGGNKHFVRNFVMRDYEGSPEWLEQQRVVGAYNWMKKEQKRVDYEDPRSMKYLHEGAPIEYDDYIKEKNISE